MTNLFKRFFTHKSKFLLIILCLLGMVFSYSCSCRADKVTGGGGPGGSPPPTTTKNSFTANPDNMNNHLDLYIQSDYKTNSVVVIKFKSKQNISGATITDIKHKSGTDIKLTTEELDYNLQDFELKLGDNEKTRKKIADALTTEGETSVITLTMELTSDSDNLNNTTTTVDVDVNLTKTIKITEQNIKDIFTKIGQLEPVTGYNFDFANATITGTKVEVENKSGKADDASPIATGSFKSELESDSFGFGQTEVRNLGFISSVKVDFIPDSISSTIASFYATITFAPKYEATVNKYQINANAKSSAGGSKGGKWKE